MLHHHLPAVWNGFKANAALLTSTATNNPVTAAYLAPNARGRDTFKLPTTEITKRIILKSTQPIIQVNGMLRWAFDNVAHASTPPCKPVLDNVKENAGWAATPENAATIANTDAYLGKLGGTTGDLYSATNAKLEVSVVWHVRVAEGASGMSAVQFSHGGSILCCGRVCHDTRDNGQCMTTTVHKITVV